MLKNIHFECLSQFGHQFLLLGLGIQMVRVRVSDRLQYSVRALGGKK